MVATSSAEDTRSWEVRRKLREGSMYRSILIAGFIAGLALPAFADSANIHSTAKADGTWWQVADGRMYWAGTFWLTSFNDSGEGFANEWGWNCPATGVMVDGAGQFKGFCIMTDGEGDKIFGSWDGGFPPGENFVGHVDYEAGTGKFEGITGGHDFACNGISADEQYICRQKAEYTLK